MTIFLQCLLCSLILVAVAPVDGGQVVMQQGYIALDFKFLALDGKTVDEAKEAILLRLPGIKINVVYPTDKFTLSDDIHAVLVRASKYNKVTGAPSFHGSRPDLCGVGKLFGVPYAEAVRRILERIPGIEVITLNYMKKAGV